MLLFNSELEHIVKKKKKKNSQNKRWDLWLSEADRAWRREEFDPKVQR